MSHHRNQKIDQDYWKKLSPEEKVWLREFNSRYYFGLTFEPKQLTPEQYKKAGEGSGERKYADAMNPQNCPKKYGGGEQVSFAIEKKVAADPIEYDIEFKPKRGRPSKKLIHHDEI